MNAALVLPQICSLIEKMSKVTVHVIFFYKCNCRYGVGNHHLNAFSSEALNAVVYQSDRYAKKWDHATHPKHS